jgi:hypothetical protein
MSTISSEKQRERNQLSTRYRNQQKRDRIDDQMRGIRTAINILIEKEKELIAESEKLKPAGGKA